MAQTFHFSRRTAEKCHILPVVHKCLLIKRKKSIRCLGKEVSEGKSRLFLVIERTGNNRVKSMVEVSADKLGSSGTLAISLGKKERKISNVFSRHPHYSRFGEPCMYHQNMQLCPDRVYSVQTNKTASSSSHTRTHTHARTHTTLPSHLRMEAIM